MRSPAARSVLLTPDGKCVAQAVGSVVGRARAVTIFGWFGRSLGLSSQYRWRCHIRCGRRRGDERLYCVGVAAFWQANAVACDYWWRTFLQRCICNEQQRHQRKTYHCKKSKDWHLPHPQRQGRPQS
jgi:hypothetical protein